MKTFWTTLGVLLNWRDKIGPKVRSRIYFVCRFLTYLMGAYIVLNWTPMVLTAIRELRGHLLQEELWNCLPPAILGMFILIPNRLFHSGWLLYLRLFIFFGLGCYLVQLGLSGIFYSVRGDFSTVVLLGGFFLTLVGVAFPGSIFLALKL